MVPHPEFAILLSSSLLHLALPTTASQGAKLPACECEALPTKPQKMGHLPWLPKTVQVHLRSAAGAL